MYATILLVLFVNGFEVYLRNSSVRKLFTIFIAIKHFEKKLSFNSNKSFLLKMI